MIKVLEHDKSRKIKVPIENGKEITNILDNMESQEMIGHMSSIISSAEDRFNSYPSADLILTMNLTHPHGGKRRLVAFRRNTCTAAPVYRYRNFRQVCLNKQRIGNHTDICAEPYKGH